MNLTCSGCGRTLNVPDTAVGKTVRCPACKTTVEVEETFSIMPEGPPAYESEARPAPDAPAGLPPARTCPNCGFLLLPDADHCSRCGTDLATGERREELVGYRASLKTKLFSRTGWIVTLAVTGAIAVVILLVALRVRSYAEKVAKEEAPAGEAPREKAEKAEAPEPAAKPLAAEPVEKPEAPAAPPEEDVEATFENAFNYLVNTSPSAQKDGLVRIAQIGGKAVPFVGKKLAECEGRAGARRMLARALGKIRQAGSSRLLVGLLTDTDPGVRAEAIESLAAHGPIARDALTAALASESASARAAGARAAKRLQFPEHTPILLGLLAGDEPAVSVQAAGAHSVRPGVPDIHAALADACARDEVAVAAAASQALVKQTGAFDHVLKTLAGRKATGEVLREPRTFFLAAPLVAWKAPVGLKMLATYLGGGRSSPEILECIKSFLDARSPVSRVEALKDARFKRVQEPQVVFAATLCLADTNSFVAGGALRYISSLDEVHYPLPLVVMLGHENIEFAIGVAAELARRRDDATSSALKQASALAGTDGATLQRRIMAAGVLARHGDDHGADLLREASLGTGGALAWDALPAALPGWAAYHFSFLIKTNGERNGETKGEAGALVGAIAERAKSSPSDVDRAYYAAAAARLGSRECLEALRGQLGPASKGFHARLVVRLLGDLHGRLKDADGVAQARDALVYQLHQNDPELLAAVVKSLRALGDASVVAAVVERIPRVKPEAALALREEVGLFGSEAEPHLLKLLEHDSPLVRRAAMGCLKDMGTGASKDVIRRLVEILQGANVKRDLRTGLPKVLGAVSGLGEKPKWTWRDWAKACRIHVKDLSERTQYKRMAQGWLSIEVPENWKVYGGTASDRKADGDPEIRAKVFSDPPGTPRARRKYKNERDFRSRRKAQLALVPTARGRQVKPGLKVEDGPADYRGKAKMLALRLIDEKQARTSYYVFLFAKVRKAHYYAEMVFSADTRYYEIYKTLFEKKIPRSIKAEL